MIALRGAGRLGTTLTVVGLVCLGGLGVLAVQLARSSGWGVMHNSPVSFLWGVACVFATPIWLIVVLITARLRKGPRLLHELFLIMMVVLTFVATVGSLQAGSTPRRAPSRADRELPSPT